jgi:hypothetical protein
MFAVHCSIVAAYKGKHVGQLICGHISKIDILTFHVNQVLFERREERTSNQELPGERVIATCFFPSSRLSIITRHYFLSIIYADREQPVQTPDTTTGLQ